MSKDSEERREFDPADIFQFERICWRDTPYQCCKYFNPPTPDTILPAGNYDIEYSCERVAWIWEKASICTITKATKR